MRISKPALQICLVASSIRIDMVAITNGVNGPEVMANCIDIHVRTESAGAK